MKSIFSTRFYVLVIVFAVLPVSGISYMIFSNNASTTTNSNIASISSQYSIQRPEDEGTPTPWATAVSNPNASSLQGAQIPITGGQIDSSFDVGANAPWLNKP
jgi:hypothetical protein